MVKENEALNIINQQIQNLINEMQNLSSKTDALLKNIGSSSFSVGQNLLNKETDEEEFISGVINREDRESFQRYYEATLSDFRQNMSYERINNKIHLADLSKNSGISVEKLEAYELGEEYYDFEHLCRIAYSLNVTLGVIFGGG